MLENKYLNICNLWIENFSKKYQISSDFLRFVFLIEDKRFLSHKGIDYLGFIRAFLVNARYLSIKQGASTISQQLFVLENSNLNLCFGKVIDKLKKVYGAIVFEKKYSKEEIMYRYLNKVYFGKSYFGVYEAALGYFNKQPITLSKAQSFFLVERIALPNKVRIDRIQRILKRPEIKKLLTQEDLEELYSIYKMFFRVKIQVMGGRVYEFL
ncbi:membrane peptidoglycan carboxypeptidase [Thermosipho japonicus]|uniref:Membrane peptidoglycan carboxypeptidase n=1 Tax=Thermosipho japonicus TaxID=90323 RepID=A0A841GSX0_9BACT|nr:biosynthetic peptidoglycan transglycosylase [Thermosipho japonicus]MBB6062798.1 membrane peptidoglycan carboxypeptidase [Thermosipho japonicus]